jgi:glutamyl-tRNA synthetase
VCFAPVRTYILAGSYCPIQLLFAKKNNGVFFYGLKIPTKIVLFQVPKLYHGSIKWLGIPPDETIGKNEKFGPIVKAKETLYREYADQY